ncbi:MAG: hypothetical protein EOO88_47215, partial [Pedobacter sp.]
MTGRTIDSLLLDETFIDFCLNPDSIHKEKWSAVQALHPEEEHIFEEAKQLINLLGPILPAAEVQQEVQKLRLHVSMLQERKVSSEPSTVFVDKHGRLGRKRIQRILMATAACVIIALGVGWLLYPSKDIPPVMAFVISTKTGERRTYMLPDGSEVILNSNSSISFENNFGGKERRVHLSGEAFFKVSKDATRPFIVS